MNQSKLFGAGLIITVMLAAAPLGAQTTTDAQAQTPNRGWEGLARVLDTLTPDIDTDPAPSGEKINADISAQLDRRQAEAALEAITQREQALASRGGPGTDVQLLFQKARALAQLDRLADAESVYREMTVRFPELAEPWNNLAVLYMQQGSLEQAQLALQTAIMNNPAYPAARTNLADLRLLMALKDYQAAAKLGASKAGDRANDLESFIGSLN